MIHLDTNLLIAASDASNVHHATARRVLACDELFAASAIAWAEYQSKPMTAELTRGVRAILQGGIAPFDETSALLAGEMFRQAGVKRAQRLDTMIAATAILAWAELATVNKAECYAFVIHGLKLFPLLPSL